MIFAPRVNIEMRYIREDHAGFWNDLGRFYRQRHPYIQHTRMSGNPRTAAHAEGRKAGRKLVLHRPIASEATSPGRMLPAKRG